MLLSYVNTFDTYTLTASSEAEGYLVGNAQAIHLSKKWRSTGDTSEYVIGGDTTSPLTPDCAFVAGHNLPSSAVVKIQGDTGDSFASPVVDITMTRGNSIYYAFAGFSEQKYWRFLIGDSTNENGYVEVGKLWLGASASIDNGPARGFTENMYDTTVQSFSRGGQAYADKGYRYKSYDVYFPYWTDAMKNDVETFADAVQLADPFFVTFDTAKADKLNPVYAVMSSGIDYSNLLGLSKWDGKISFREVF